MFVASLEQDRVELVERMACSLAKVDSQALRKGQLDPGELARLKAAGDRIARAMLRIDHSGQQTVLVSVVRPFASANVTVASAFGARNPSITKPSV